MITIRLKERQEEILSGLKITDTFKIPESSFIFMKVDVDGLTVQPAGQVDDQHPKQPPIKVLIPEGKTTVVCLNTGKTQFLNLIEKVQIVNLQCTETLEEKGE